MWPSGRILVDAGARKEWREGWPLVLASVVGTSVTSIMVYSLGVLMGPLQQQFGWSKAEISSGLLINSIVTVVLAPFAGRLIDRFGPRRICLPGLVLFTCAYAALATTNGSLWQWRILWVFLSLTSLMLMPAAFTMAVSSRFDRSRGTALAVTLCGTGLAGVLVPPTTGLLLKAYGWQWAYVGAALIWFLVAFPLFLLFLRDAGDLHRKAGPRAEKPSPAPSDGASVRDALRSATFLKLAASCFLLMLVIGAMVIHMVPILLGAGLDPMVAASMASIIGATNIFSRLTTGFLLDRFSPPIVGGVAFGLPAVLMGFLLAYDGSTGMAVLLAVLLGLSSGAELQIAAYMSSRYLGMKNYGLLFGAIVGLLALALGIGPMIMGAVFDHFGSYRLAFIAGIPLSLTASLLLFSFGGEEVRLASRQAEPRPV